MFSYVLSCEDKRGGHGWQHVYACITESPGLQGDQTNQS